MARIFAKIIIYIIIYIFIAERSEALNEGSILMMCVRMCPSRLGMSR